MRCRYIYCAAQLSAIALSCSFSWNMQAKKEQKKTHAYFNKAQEEKVTFYARESVDSDKKILRKGVLIKRPNAPATVLICHGFMCDKFDVSFLHILFKKYNSMTFDFRAHGEEIHDQQCTLGRNEAYDVIAAAEFIRNHPALKNKPLILYGFSMGAAASIIAQAQNHRLFDALILDCSFDSTDKLLERGLNQLKISIFGYELYLPGQTLFKSYAYSPYVQSILKTILKTFTKMDATQINTYICPVYPEEAIKYIDKPCLFIGCINDDKAPVEAITTLYNNCPGYARCWISSGRRHYDTIFFKLRKYFKVVDKFVADFLTGKYRTKAKKKLKRDKSLAHLPAIPDLSTEDKLDNKLDLVNL